MQPKHAKDNFSRKSTPSERVMLLDSDSDDGEDGRVDFSRPSGSQEGNLAKVKADIVSVTKTMQNNMSKVLDRGAKIEDLQDKSENLDLSAFKFVSGSRKLQRKMWWQNVKLKLLFGFIAFGLLLVLILSFVMKKK